MADLVQSPSPSLLNKVLAHAEIPVHSIPISEIRVVPGRGRKEFGDIDGLAKQIKHLGLINPVMVAKAPGPDGKQYTLVAGERRLRAHCYLSRTHIDARIRDECPEVLQKQIELDENISRKELHWIEAARITDQIHELMVGLEGQKMKGSSAEAGWTLEKTGNLLGISKGTVSEQIKASKVLKAQPDLKEKLGHLPLRVFMKELDKVDTAERLSRLVSEGKITLVKDLRLGDSRLLIQELPDSSIDMILTDPPFGIPNLTKYQGQTMGANNSMTYTATGEDSDNLSTTEVINLMQIMLFQFNRVLKPGAHAWIFLSYEIYPALLDACRASGLGFDPTPVTWYKGETTAPCLGYRPAPCSEPILFCWKPLPDDPDLKGRKLMESCKSLMEFKPERAKIHRYQKPQDLLAYLIKLSSHAGEKILDPFAGSGAVLKAATKSGRGALGFEISEPNYLQAQAWLKGA